MSKGSNRRPTDEKQYAENYDKIFRKLVENAALSGPPSPPGFYQKSIAELMKEPEIKPGDLHK